MSTHTIIVKSSQLITCSTAFPDCITLDAIYSSLKATHDSIQLLSQSGPTTVPAPFLNGLYSTILSQPLSKEAASSVGQMWKAMQTFESAECLSFLDLHAQRRRIMVTNYSQWLWLETAMVSECRTILTSTDSKHSGWISKLVFKIRTAVEARTQSVIFRSKDFIPGLTCSPYHYYSSERSRFTGGDDDVHELTARIFKDIVKHWLGYPSDELSEMRFYFTAYILRCFPPSVLLIKEVWDAYQNLRHMVFGRRTRARLSPQSFSDVFMRMRTHPLAIPNSKEVELIGLIGNLFDQFSQLSITPVEPLPSIPPSPSTNHVPMRIATSSSSSHISSCSPEPAQDVHTVDMFLEYLRELMPLTDMGCEGPMSTLMTNVMKDPDGLLPWRLKAPCLNAAFADGDPFSKDIINTTIGLWNGLVLRGITFGCDIVKEGPILYDSLDAWDDTVKANASRDSQYLCKPNVYGNAIYNRFKGIGHSVNMASNYWEAAHASNWSSMGRGDYKTFDAAVEFFKQFDLIGPLIAVLMAGDYACAGKFDMPDAYTMGGYIKSISAGALGCMNLMGTVVGKGTKETCRTAFKNLYCELDKRLTEAEKKRIGFSTIMLEHAMCKYYKAVKYNLF